MMISDWEETAKFEHVVTMVIENVAQKFVACKNLSSAEQVTS